MERALGHPRGIDWVDDQNNIKTKQESTRLPHSFVGCMTNFNKTLINWMIVFSNLGAEVDHIIMEVVQSHQKFKYHKSP